MIEVGAVYLPQDRRLALTSGVRLPTRSVGAALFADISGFTPLTEALTRGLGPRRGIEELAAQINAVYDVLIAEVERFGGTVVSFAGDAITCWFAERSAAPDAALRACACALTLQRAMGGFAAVPLPQGGAVALGLKVSIASGETRRILVGEPSAQLLDALVGAPLSRTAAGEHLAERGEIIVDQATADQLGTAALLGEQRRAADAAYSVLDSLLLDVAPAPWPPERPLGLEQVRGWLLPPVYARLLDGLGEFFPELRPAVALFLNFDGLDYDSDPTADTKLDRLIRAVQAILARYGGTLLQLTVGDKGSYCYAAFGAPLSHEDNARRAVAAALELRGLHAELRFLQPVRIGLSQGMMRAGAYGGQTRRTYGVLGDEVNLAARLMQQAAPGEVLASGRVVEQVGAAFAWDLLPAVSVKGKRAPVPLARLIGARTPRDPAQQGGALIGRATELAALLAMARPIFAGRFGGCVTLFGEPGMGKSRLVAELRRQLSARSSAVTWLTLPADEILRQSLNPFRTMLRGYLGQEPDATPDANVQHANAALDDLLAALTALTGRRRGAQLALSAELRRTRSFLTALVDLREPGSLYDQLEPQLRFENTLAALRALLLAESLRRPLVLHLEDAQWLDDDSVSALQQLTRAVAGYPLLVLVSSRYRDDGRPVTVPLDPAVPQQTVELGPLLAAGVQQVAEGVLGATVAADLAALLNAKTGGNPFFVEQLALDLRERQLLVGREAAAGSGTELTLSGADAVEVPDTINAVLIARLDRLAARVRAVVQTAAVLGQEFEVRLLAGMLRDDPALTAQVREAERETIWTALTELRYLFRHALLRDAAYAMQLRARLRDLHRLAAEVIAQIHAGDLAASAADLAYHYGRAEDAPQERRYSRMAAEYAAARYANADAVRHYSRALELTSHADGPGRYALLLAREQIYDLQGSREQQRADIAALDELARQLDDPQREIQVALRTARHADVTGDYPAMVAAAQRAIELAEAAHDQPGVAAGQLHLARASWYQGAYADVQRAANRALELARAAGERRLEADSLRILGNAAMYQGDYDAARAAYIEALASQTARNDHHGASYTRNNLGIIAWYQGDHARARAEYEQALTTLREIGDRYGQSLALLNLGEVAGVQGDYLGAQEYYSEALRLKRETGDRYGESVVLSSLGDVQLTLADWEGARASYDAALALTAALGHRQQQGWALARLGLLLHQGGEHAAALEHAERALAAATEINDRNTQGYALTLRGHALAALNRTADAAADYAAALELRRALQQPNHATEPLAGLVRLALAADDQAAALNHAETLLAHLAQGTLEGTDEPFRIYLACVQALRTGDDARATPLLAQARALLTERAARIADPDVRRTFLERVPFHRALLAETDAV